ncbi:2953_t:CDS:2 [Paraglomus brasilianum]|uniref:2953_t:CDS:1 n=1 Tax=Paraglomus brasilianum TaxID=144538 RepID=A0A9N8WA85_9GLOM|nr:2953_t:CDS:2 [Paraglomus brasilianum]
MRLPLYDNLRALQLPRQIRCKRFLSSVCDTVWKPENDSILEQLVAIHGKSPKTFDKVAEGIPESTSGMCLQRWRYLHPEDNVLEIKGYPPKDSKELARLTNKYWTDEEDKLLIEAARMRGREWKQISEEHIPHRTYSGIRFRWFNHIQPQLIKENVSLEQFYKIANDIRENGPAPYLEKLKALQFEDKDLLGSETDFINFPIETPQGISRSSRYWTAEEDKILIEAMQKHGRKWKQISNDYIPCRTHVAVRYRWFNRIRPLLIYEYLSLEQGKTRESPTSAYLRKWKSMRSRHAVMLSDKEETKKFSSKAGKDATRFKSRCWTIEEDKILVEVIRKRGRKWREISDEYFPHRTHLAVRFRWFNRIQPLLINEDLSLEQFNDVINSIIQNGADNLGKISKEVPAVPLDAIKSICGRKNEKTRHKPRQWTKEEDDFIREQVMLHGYKWTLIASKLTNAETYQVRHRYFSNSTRNTARRKWTSEEDKILLRQIAKYGMNWQLVVAGLTGRTDIDCLFRWLTLSYNSSSKNDLQWSAREQKVLWTRVADHGDDWNEVTKGMPRRSAYDCKNYCMRFYKSLSDAKLVRLDASESMSNNLRELGRFMMTDRVIGYNSHLGGKTYYNKRSYWSQEELNTLCTMAETYRGKIIDWEKISAAFKERSPSQCHAQWDRVRFAPSSWTVAEDEILKNLLSGNPSIDWATIAQRLPGRTVFQCKNRWHEVLNPVSKSKPFSQYELALLRKAVEVTERGPNGGINWSLIVQRYFPTRGRKQLFDKWHRLTYETFSERTLGRWTQEENELLIKGVEKYKGSPGMWQKIAYTIGSRTRFQCRHRWSFSLDPRLKKGSWGMDELKLLLEGIEKHGLKWATIAKTIPGRSDRACAQKFYELKDCHVKRKKRRSPGDWMLTLKLENILRRFGSNKTLTLK